MQQDQMNLDDALSLREEWGCVELYMDADSCVEIRRYGQMCLTVIDEYGEMAIVPITTEMADRIAQGLIEWSKTQRSNTP